MVNHLGKFSLFLLIAGCSDIEFKPKEFKSAGDIKPGPGLFSGEEGKFILYKGDPFMKKEVKEKRQDLK